MKYFLIYLGVINLITFVAFFVDKQKAKKKKWRIKESVLLSLSALGGALGGFTAMQLFRHKTQTAIFKFGVPLMLILQIAAIVFLIYKKII